MTRRFIVALIEGSAEDLNQNFVRCPGMTAFEVGEDTYNFLYNTLVEQGNKERKRRGP